MERIIYVLYRLIMVVSITIGIFTQQGIAANQDNEFGLKDDLIQHDKSPINKLGRGAINTATFWAEVPAGVFRVSEDRGPALGVTLGIAEGAFTALLRGMTGIFDLVTFAIPPYNKPLMKPEYALQNLDEKQKEYLW